MTIRSVVGASEGYGSSRFSISAANPYANHGEFYPIATVTVGSGGASSIEFTSIPGTYQHLQIRGIFKSTNAASSANQMKVRLNADSGTNYSQHYLLGTGASASAGGAASQTSGEAGYIPFTSNFGYSTDRFGAAVIDLLDYANTSKNTTTRSFWGFDFNFDGSTPGWVGLSSSAWLSSSAVTSITFTTTNNFAQFTTAALYGLRAP